MSSTPGPATGRRWLVLVAMTGSLSIIMWERVRWSALAQKRWSARRVPIG